MMGFIRNQALIAIGALSLHSAAFAANWKCNDVTFSKQPAWDGDTYVIPLISTCTVPQPTKQGFVSLHEFFLDRFKKMSKVESGPKQEVLDGLPGQVWEVEDRFQQNGDDMVVQNTTHIACDDQTRLISSTYSSNVQGSGSSSYVTYLDSVIDATSSDGKTFKVLFEGTIKLGNKPFYIPSGLFEDGGESSAKKSFAETRDQLIPQIAGSI